VKPLSSLTGNILRWFLFPPTVLAVALAGLVASILVLEIVEDRWLAVPVMAAGTAVAVYVGSRIVPSRRRLSVPLASGLIALAILYLLSLTAEGDREARALALGGAGGIAAGALLAFRRTRPRPVHAFRNTERGSLRYRGTAPFQFDSVDRKTFFGRDREIRSLLSLILAERLVVVFGKSGTGKSSLINAGLVGPLFERGYLPMTLRLSGHSGGPIAALLDGVRTAALSAGVEIAGGDAPDLWGFFTTAEFWSRTDDLLQPVLVLDQFEELFTLHDPSPRREFISQLAELVRGPSPRPRSTAAAPSAAPAPDAAGSQIRIVISLREDYLADLEELARDIPGILQHRFRIGALTSENARDAIVQPAALEDAAFATPPFTYTEGAVQRILTFLARRRQRDETVKGDDVEPTQLQLVCQYVEELVRTRLARRDGTRVQVTEADLGGESRLQRILEDFYDRTLASIDTPWQRRRVQRLCEHRLISRAGRRLTEAEEEIEKQHGVAVDTLRQLVDARLLRTEPRLGGVFYELSHDTLIEPIQRSRKKRIARRRWGWAAAAALLLAYLAPWWLLSGRDNRVRQQALALIAESLPDRDDPGQLLALPRARLTQIEGELQNGVRSRDAYAAMMFAAEDVGLRYPELSLDVQNLRRAITERFNREHGLMPVDSEESSLNRRILIEGGSFLMGSPEGAGDDHERPQHRVTLSSFRIQEHEVTNAEYRRFDPNHDRLAPDNHPVVNVSWYEAAAYAAWIGGSLPTEAQWEFVARGTAGRPYPWGGNEPTCTHANFQECGAVSRPVRTGRDQGQTPEEVYDLAGNAWEWCRDWWGDYSADDRQDPLGAPTGSARVVRGGSFLNIPYDLRGVNRYSSAPEVRDPALGFRVVWSVEEAADRSVDPARANAILK
jgi:hypothetical protein